MGIRDGGGVHALGWVGGVVVDAIHLGAGACRLWTRERLRSS